MSKEDFMTYALARIEAKHNKELIMKRKTDSDLTSYAIENREKYYRRIGRRLTSGGRFGRNSIRGGY